MNFTPVGYRSFGSSLDGRKYDTWIQRSKSFQGSMKEVPVTGSVENSLVPNGWYCHQYYCDASVSDDIVQRFSALSLYDDNHNSRNLCHQKRIVDAEFGNKHKSFNSYWGGVADDSYVFGRSYGAQAGEYNVSQEVFSMNQLSYEKPTHFSCPLSFSSKGSLPLIGDRNPRNTIGSVKPRLKSPVSMVNSEGTQNIFPAAIDESSDDEINDSRTPNSLIRLDSGEEVIQHTSKILGSSFYSFCLLLSLLVNIVFFVYIMHTNYDNVKQYFEYFNSYSVQLLDYIAIQIQQSWGRSSPYNTTLELFETAFNYCRNLPDVYWITFYDIFTHD